MKESMGPDRLRETDALLFLGGDVPLTYPTGCDSRTGELLPSLRRTVYVGVSAGKSMAATATFGETVR